MSMNLQMSHSDPFARLLESQGQTGHQVQQHPGQFAYPVANMTMSNAVNLMNPSVTAINNNNSSAVKPDESVASPVKQVSVKNHPVCALSYLQVHPHGQPSPVL